MTTPTTHEQAAFGGAASVTEQPSYDEIMRKPWQYPQGRVPLPASHPLRITPPEDDDPWRDVRLPWSETLLIVAVLGVSLAAAVSVLVVIFRSAT